MSRPRWYETAQSVLEGHSYARVDNRSGLPRVGEARFDFDDPIQQAHEQPSGCMILDATTAQALVTVADALRDDLRERFLAMSLPVAVTVAWKLLRRTS